MSASGNNVSFYAHMCLCIDGHSPRDRMWCTRARNLTHSPSSASETEIKDLNSGAAMAREPNQ